MTCRVSGARAAGEGAGVRAAADGRGGGTALAEQAATARLRHTPAATVASDWVAAVSGPAGTAPYPPPDMGSAEHSFARPWPGVGHLSMGDPLKYRRWIPCLVVPPPSGVPHECCSPSPWALL